MRISPTHLAGSAVVEINALSDERGFFARTFCMDTFRERGMAHLFPHHNISWNPHCGTLRGMHYQAEPRPEVKLVRCTRGCIFDVIVDLRPASPTYRQWFGVELDCKKRNALYIPAGFAHGFQTLVDDCEVLYAMGDVYVPELARGVRWNDRAFAIEWPIPPILMSDRDASYPDYIP